MKKILILILILVAMFSYAESYEYSGDLWQFVEINSEEDYIGISWRHDLEHSELNGLNPKDFGLLSTTIVIGKDYDTNKIILAFSYKTSIEYHIPHYIICFDENRDSYLLGGNATSGDYSENYFSKEDGFFYSSIIITLSEEDVRYLNKDVYFEITEFYNAHSIYFGIPEEIFRISFGEISVK